MNEIEYLTKISILGLPDKNKFTPLPKLEKPTTWEFGVQRHSARRAGEHYDIRLGNPKTGIAHSWASRSPLPEPGKKIIVIEQPDHAIDYMNFAGEIPEGYGAGKVALVQRDQTEIIKSQPGKIQFAVHSGHDSDEYVLIDIGNRKWILQNITQTKEKRPDIPQSKPPFKETKPERIDFENLNQAMTAKIDGAHVEILFGKPNSIPRIFSYRPTERKTGIIEHTFRVPDILLMRTPPELKNTIVRAELYAKDKKTGKALPAATIGGMLNSNVWKSRQMQREKGKLIPTLIDVVKYKGKNFEDKPFLEKRKALEEIASTFGFEVPPIAITPEQKRKLFEAIKKGKVKETKEGVVLHDLEKGTFTKVKFRPDYDVYVKGIVPPIKPGAKERGEAGGFYYGWTKDPKEIVGKVGTGFTQKLRREMLENPEDFIGRLAKVRSQEVYRHKETGKRHGALRAPSFVEWHLDEPWFKKGEFFWNSFEDELEKIAVHVSELANIAKKLTRKLKD